MHRDLRRRRTWRIRRRARRAVSRFRDAVVAARGPSPGRRSHRFDAGVRVGWTLERIERRARRRGSSAWHRCRARGCSGRRYGTLRRMRATTADREQSSIYTYLICLAAWAIPGAGHLLLGRVQKGVTFLITLTLMSPSGCAPGPPFPTVQASRWSRLSALAISASNSFLHRPRMGAGAGVCGAHPRVRQTRFSCRRPDEMLACSSRSTSPGTKMTPCRLDGRLRVLVRSCSLRSCATSPRNSYASARVCLRRSWSAVWRSAGFCTRCRCE